MQRRSSNSLSWPQLLAALRKATGTAILVRDRKATAPASALKSRPAAKGTELCLFTGEGSVTRATLVERLDALSKSAGRQFVTSAKALIGDSTLLIESVVDEDLDGTPVTVIDTRRPTLGYNQSQQVGASSTLRSKRIRTGS